MEKENPVHKGTESALFLLAEKRTEYAFRELLDYATEVCLKTPPVYLTGEAPSHYEATDTENIIVQSLGARTLAVTLELKNGMHAKEIGPDDEEPAFKMAELLEVPHEFSDRLNFRMLENAERFGQALIDESFAILGKDAEAQAQKLKSATNEDEEGAVIDWLNHRIQTICEKSRSESSREDEENFFYPPFRISPKFIGAYPSIEVQPSCLSASVMAASFFEKADVATMHAGVTSPASEAGTVLLLEMIQRAVNSEKYEAFLPRMIPLAKGATGWLERPIAQHAAVYAKLSSSWVQFDPYGDVTYFMLDEESDQLSTAYDSLSEWKGVMPNLEFTTAPAPNDAIAMQYPEHASLSFILSEYEHSETLLPVIDLKLKTIPDESYQSYLYDTCVQPFLDPLFRRNLSEGTRAGIKEHLAKYDIPELERSGVYDTRFNKLFDTVLTRYILQGDSSEEFIKRCASDPEYRRRRAEDFLAVPMLMAVTNAALVAQTDMGYAHLSVDVGNPAMRIGLATLSDFALYDDYPLPASFWTTHWPGAVSVLENLDNPPTSSPDAALLYNSIVATKSHPFTSIHNYDKVSSFLSTYGKVEEDARQEDCQEEEAR